MNSVVHFEIPADDMERAKKFYQTVFGWKIVPYQQDVAMANTTEVDKSTMRPKTPGAINGDIVDRKHVKSTVVVIYVDDIDEKMKEIEANGGKSLGPTITIENFGWSAFFLDSENNLSELFKAMPTSNVA